MYLVSEHGQATSCCPGARGTMTECRHGTNSAWSPIFSSTAVPMRVMMRIDTTTYGESVSSTPNIGCSAVSGPMQNGMTYMVRPLMLPRYRSVMTRFMSAGAIQLLVGPASASSTEQMNVRSSTRATSDGSVFAQNEFGLISGFSGTSAPLSTSSPVNRSHSAGEPSHQTTASGVVSSATSRTQASSRGWDVGACSRPLIKAGAVMRALLTVDGYATVSKDRWIALSLSPDDRMGRLRACEKMHKRARFFGPVRADVRKIGRAHV